MKNILLIVLCIFISILTTNFLARKRENNLLKDFQYLYKEKEQLDYQSSKFKHLFMTHLKYEDFDLNLNKLQSGLINSDTMVFFRIFKENCKDCIEKHFKAINAVSSNKIVALSSFENPIDILLMKEKCKVTIPFVSLSEMYEGEDTSYPYFVAIKNGKVSNFFIPNEDDSTTTVKYLQQVLNL